ncbi:uncharacterized protein LOC117342773 [Pecten maximus]|uniref:uncharacterized protein LOC117342773 n=1 Tax=Pecten maximus TaxID=6579 RepID=UPI00145860C6|nr:uncharacterized protein LOC117342773 [Pecten maximus]XP_033760907.1 uncharacterized protein LOC117342773 [Pecten maximus]XP_033760908.1 uncharacterized protein LOC117342773 [Pecten maximus]XP_033760909.1 uncharacterized protein LOC117342773 [Pecten maximus]XP_033760910.1 uncharacterized protein LOC117342773 [Pecten maximus]XP_033760911.1 uncharacterized protein LOC117342773 [Pecten maximus]XP_033760912.1 uncharacterized protein LOC117342773 [Pecten maximus]XP_033760913.1 uncharacterized p
MELSSRGLLLMTYLHISTGFSAWNSKLLFPTSIGRDDRQMTSSYGVEAEANIQISNQENSIGVLKSNPQIHKQTSMIQAVHKRPNNERLFKWISARTRKVSAGTSGNNVLPNIDSTGSSDSAPSTSQNVDSISNDGMYVSKEERIDDLNIVNKNTTMFTEHTRMKRSTNGTAAESTSFMDDPNKVAMFIVLPLIIFVYGGCICIYCVHKCQDYVERVEPLKTIKQKVFGVPPEAPEPHSRKWMQHFMKRPRPTSSRSLPDPESTEQKEFDTRSIFSDAGISYFRDTTKDSAFSEMDIDSGVHSQGSRANEKVIYVNADSPDIKNLNDFTVEVKHVETSEIAVQTDDIHITTISTADMGVATCEAGTSMYEKPPQRKAKKKENKVGSRYLSWLKSARELREVLNNNTEPRTLHQMLKIAAEEHKQGETVSDSEVKQQKGQKVERQVETKPAPKRQNSSPIISVEPYQNDASYISIHKKKSNLLKQHGSFKGISNAVTPLETRYKSTSTSASSSRGTDSPPGDAPPPYYRLGETKGNSYMSMYKKKPIVSKEDMGRAGSGDVTKYVGINNSDTDSLM